MKKRYILLSLILALILSSEKGAAQEQCTFQNPIMDGADPFAFFHKGNYYILVTKGDRITIRSAPNLQDIGSKNEIKVWEFYGSPVGGHVWAPEMFYIDGDWYIYSCGQNTGKDYNTESVPYVEQDQQMFVLKSATGDPFGPYEFDSWLMPGIGAIDETIFTHTDGKRYIIWSQFNLPEQGQGQCLYIAELTGHKSIGLDRIKISCPRQRWELYGWPVNEGAAVLKRNGLTYIVYSGSGYTTPEYSLGYLVNKDGDLLNPNSWEKVGPVFTQNPDGGIYSTGHNSFTTSPDGTEDWIVYHGRLGSNGSLPRKTFIQKFTWENDVPVFGIPTPVTDFLVCPSDTGTIISEQQFLNEDIMIYPNPAGEFLNIELPEALEAVNLKIYNNTGQLVHDSIRGYGQLDISNLHGGIYFVNITSGRYTYSVHLVKS